MKLNSKLVNIAITIDISKGFLSNGLQQNLIFLADCINLISGKKCYFLYLGVLNSASFISKYPCISYASYLKDKEFKFDLIIYGGFLPNPKDLSFDQSRWESTKSVSLQLGNEMNHDIDNSLHRSEKKIKRSLTANLYSFDQIWTSPHYEHSVPYLATKYHNKNVKIAPYIWNDTFIKLQLADLGLSDDIESFQSNLDIQSISVFEPNIYYTKTCLIPLFIAENFEQKNPNKIKSLNIFGGQSFVKNEYFMKLILSMDIYTKRNNFLKVHPRRPLLKSLRDYGSLIISHQILNELNYLYLEALYLSIPLIHNANCLKDYGYFYNDFNIFSASNHIENILKNHKNNLTEYTLKNKELFKKYSSTSKKNIKSYENLINNLIAK